MDTAQFERVEGELDAFIAKRDKERRKHEGTRPEEALYAESSRRYQERRRRQNVAAWFGFYCRMADNHAALAQEYERRAEELCEEGER